MMMFEREEELTGNAFAFGMRAKVWEKPSPHAGKRPSRVRGVRGYIQSPSSPCRSVQRGVCMIDPLFLSSGPGSLRISGNKQIRLHQLWLCSSLYNNTYFLIFPMVWSHFETIARKILSRSMIWRM